MDFYEQIIKHKKSRKDYFMILLTVFAGLAFLVLASALIPAFLPLWIFIPCWFGYFAISGRCLEYEYSITNHVIDIDRIAGKRRRRKMIVIDLKEIIGHGTPGDEPYRAAVKKGLRVLDFSSGADETGKYYLIVPRPKATYIVIMEPNETMLACMNVYLNQTR